MSSSCLGCIDCQSLTKEDVKKNIIKAIMSDHMDDFCDEITLHVMWID